MLLQSGQIAVLGVEGTRACVEVESCRLYYPQGLDDVEPVLVIVAEGDDVGELEPDALTLTDELGDTDGDALPVELMLPLDVDVPHVDAELLIVTEGDPLVEDELA
jgi:hypothetical protein